MNRLQARLHDSSGYSILEMALILLVFLPITLGFIDLARIFTNYAALTESATTIARNLVAIKGVGQQAPKDNFKHTYTWKRTLRRSSSQTSSLPNSYDPHKVAGLWLGEETLGSFGEGEVPAACRNLQYGDYCFRKLKDFETYNISPDQLNLEKAVNQFGYQEAALVMPKARLGCVNEKHCLNFRMTDKKITKLEKTLSNTEKANGAPTVAKLRKDAIREDIEITATYRMPLLFLHELGVVNSPIITITSTVREHQELGFQDRQTDIIQGPINS